MELLSDGETVFLALSLISDAATSRANSPVGTLEGVVEVEVGVECTRAVEGADAVEHTSVVEVAREVAGVIGAVCVVRVEEARVT